MWSLKGQQIVESVRIKNLISELVREVAEINSDITTVISSDIEHQESGWNWIKRSEKARGRPLFYPFVGSGAGNGSYVELMDGSIKLDLINAMGVNLFGHSHPRIMQATLNGALADIVWQGNLLPNKEYAEVKEIFIQLAQRKSRLQYCWLSTCGSMANENALKIVLQKKSPASKIVAMNDAFAGRTLSMAEITDNPAYREGLPHKDEVLRVPFFDKKDLHSSERSLKILKEHIDKNRGNICAFMFEPFQGEGGFRFAPREFFIPLFDECKLAGIPIWIDEIQTFGRTGEIFCFEKLDIGSYIDICTIGKVAQIAATLYTEEYNPKAGLIAGTFAGPTSALSAAKTILNMLVNDNYLGEKGKINQVGASFVRMLFELSSGSCKEYLGEPEGVGLMVAITPFNGNKMKVQSLMKKLFDNGLIVFSCGHGEYRLRFLLSAILEDKDIKLAKGIIEKSVLEVAKE